MICPICGKETQEPEGICLDCRGKKTEGEKLSAQGGNCASETKDSAVENETRIRVGPQFGKVEASVPKFYGAETAASRGELPKKREKAWLRQFLSS